MKKIFCYCIPVISLLFSGTAFSQGKIAVKQNDKYEMTSILKMNITQEMMGQTMEISSDINSTNTITVKSVQDNNYTLGNTLSKMKMTGSAMGQDLSYDSENASDKDSQIGQALGDKIGKTTEVTVDETGKVIGVKKDPKDKTEGGGMGSMMGIGGTDKDGGLGIFFARFNAATVKAGDSWTDSTQDKEQKTVTAYTVKEIKEGNTTLTFSSNITINRTQETQGMEVVVNMTGKATGESTYDANGVLSQTVSNTEMTGTTEVMGNSIPMTNKILAIINVKKK